MMEWILLFVVAIVCTILGYEFGTKKFGRYAGTCIIDLSRTSEDTISFEGLKDISEWQNESAIWFDVSVRPDIPDGIYR